MCEYSFIVPVLNEENKLEDCLTEIKNSIKKHNMDAEIIVVDNGSSDNSKIIAKQNGARVFCCSNEGYGNAINFGISKADGKYSIMGDADGSYDFFMIDSMISKMHNSDIIVGNRFTNKKEDNKSTIDENKKLAMIEENSKDDNSLTSEKLENILSKINGVGKVKVYITYSQTSQIIPIYNEDISQKDTQEEDTQGGTRKVVETDTKKEVVYDEKSGSKTIITQSIVSPKIEGAIVTAEGGNNTNTKANIIQAVEAVTRVTNTQNSSI